MNEVKIYVKCAYRKDIKVDLKRIILNSKNTHPIPHGEYGLSRTIRYEFQQGEVTTSLPREHFTKYIIIKVVAKRNTKPVFECL